MTDIFGQTYAGAYDALYRGKDYEGEVDVVERILVREGLSGPRRILDLGCGTGNHVLPLASRGHAVVGVDRSPAMLVHARAKAAAALTLGDAAPSFLEGDIRTVDAGARFDAVIMMFAVLCYLPDESDIFQSLATVRRHLEPGGLFIFDIWNGQAVLADRPKGRRMRVEDGTTTIERETQTRLDLDRHLCHVAFDLTRTNAEGQTETVREDHVVRYFFEPELVDLLGRGGLDLLSLRGFPDERRPADETAWNVVGVARAV